MDRVYKDGAAIDPPLAPLSPSVGYPTDGDQGTNTIATQPGEYWFHMVTESLVKVIEGAGLTPDHEDLTQLTESIRRLSKTNVLHLQGTRFLTVDDAGSVFVDLPSPNTLGVMYLPEASLLPGMEFEFTVTSNHGFLQIAPFSGDTVDGGVWPHQVDKYSSFKIKSDGVNTWRRVLATPVGTVAAFAGRASIDYAAPAGWWHCNGEAVRRDYWPNLFSTIGETYGPGNGTTTFNLPDLRGEFVRGADDGRSIDVGRTLGTPQLDALQNITGGVENIQIDETSVIGAVTGAFQATDNGANGNSAAFNSPGIDITFDASRVARTADETRPRNVAMHYCIKY